MVKWLLFSFMAIVCVFCLACGIVLFAYGAFAGGVLMMAFGIFGMGSGNAIIFNKAVVNNG